MTTEACTAYYNDGKVISGEILEQINEALAVTEVVCGKNLAISRPFLVPSAPARALDAGRWTPF